ERRVDALAGASRVERWAVAEGFSATTCRVLRFDLAMTVPAHVEYAPRESGGGHHQREGEEDVGRLVEHPTAQSVPEPRLGSKPRTCVALRAGEANANAAGVRSQDAGGATT